jgi:hypothetical protein
LGEGWDEQPADYIYETNALWASAQTSRIFVPLDQIQGNANYRLTLRAHPFAYPGSAPQTVRAVVNGKILDEKNLGDGWQIVEWELPASAWVNGLNRVEWQWGYAISPRQALGGNRSIGATGVELPIDVELNSFEDNGFIALFEEQGEQIDASAGRRGVNVTVLDPANGRLLEKRGFDTTANAFESEKLAEFLAQIPLGQATLIASRGAAAAYLTPAVIDALRTLGIETSLAALAGQHFVMVGVKGAPASSALSVLHPTQAFAALSRNRDRRTLAAAVDRVEIRRVEGN